MIKIPDTGPDAGSDTVSENPALTGGVFRSGPDNPHKRIADMVDFGIGAGRDFNDMLANAGPDRIADLIEFGDNDLDTPHPDPHKLIVDMIDNGDDHFEFAGAESASEAAGADKRVPPRVGLRCRKNQPEPMRWRSGAAKPWWSMSSHPGRLTIACG